MPDVLLKKKPKFFLNNFLNYYFSEMSKKDSTSEEVDPLQPLVPVISEKTVNFIKAKEEFKKAINFHGTLYRYKCTG